MLINDFHHRIADDIKNSDDLTLSLVLNEHDWRTNGAAGLDINKCRTEWHCDSIGQLKGVGRRIKQIDENLLEVPACDHQVVATVEVEIRDGHSPRIVDEDHNRAIQPPLRLSFQIST